MTVEDLFDYNFFQSVPIIPVSRYGASLQSGFGMQGAGASGEVVWVNIRLYEAPVSITPRAMMFQ
jgi:hypothetical protein